MTAVEDDLAASWDAAHLAVYGDYLMSLGDPRGELIALDLLGGGPEVIARKNELLVAWIGEALLARILATGAIECGFVELYVDENPLLLADVLASPAGPFLRTLTMRGRGTTVFRMMTALVADARPWLARLAVVQTSPAGAPVARPITHPIASALPRLAELDVTGDDVFSRLAIPQLRTLRITGVAAIAPPAELPAVIALDVAFGVPGTHRTPSHAALADLAPPERFPALVRLDLSRNEPGAFAPHNLGLAVDPFAWLCDREIRAQLVDLAIPSVRTEAQSETLQRALDGMPALRRIEQVRRYALRDARFPVPPDVQRTLGWPRPWLPPDALGDATFAVRPRDDAPPEVCHVLPLATWLDQHASQLSEHALSAWGHLFGFLDRLVVRTPQPFPGIVLDTALATLGDGERLSGWLRVRFLLRRPSVQIASLSVPIQRLA